MGCDKVRQNTISAWRSAGVLLAFCSGFGVLAFSIWRSAPWRSALAFWGGLAFWVWRSAPPGVLGLAFWASGVLGLAFWAAWRSAWRSALAFWGLAFC